MDTLIYIHHLLLATVEIHRLYFPVVLCVQQFEQKKVNSFGHVAHSGERTVWYTNLPMRMKQVIP